MPTPHLTNILILGSWNRAILTPDGIRKLIFNLPDGTPFNIEVEMDMPGTFRGLHDGVAVIPRHECLEFLLQENTPAGLVNASRVAARSLEILPRTPLKAGGINFHFRGKSAKIEEILGSELDNILSNNLQTILNRGIQRALQIDGGTLNLMIQEKPDNTLEILFNFHREATDSSILQDWVSRAPEFAAIADKLCETIIDPIE